MAEVFIDPNGSDSNGDGSRSNPWATIGHAASNISDGDTITCLSGTYDWPNVWSGNDITDLDVTVKGETGDWRDVIFDGGGGNVDILMNPGPDKSHDIHDILFKNVSRESDNSPIFNIKGNGVRNFTGCRFSTLRGPDGSHNGGVFGGRNTGSAIETMRFRGCDFYRCQSDIIFGQVYNVDTLISLIGCTYWDDGAGPFGTSIGSLFKVHVNDTGLLRLKNNIFFFTYSVELMEYDDEFASFDIDHNCIQNLDMEGHNGPNDITADPLFIDAVNGDFDLRPGSPCIGAGTANV